MDNIINIVKHFLSYPLKNFKNKQQMIPPLISRPIPGKVGKLEAFGEAINRTDQDATRSWVLSLKVSF